jgi:hypothetical protein
MMFRNGILVIVAVLSVSLSVSGCLPQTKWSENLAPIGIASDPALNDQNVYTEGQSEPMKEVMDTEKMLELDKFTEVSIEWNEPQEIAKIVVKGKSPLVQFDVDVETDEGWKTVRKVEYNKREICPVTFETVQTRKLRLKIPRAYKVRGKESETINIARGGRRQSRNSGATPTQGIRTIAEIEVYKKIETPKE